MKSKKTVKPKNSNEVESSKESKPDNDVKELQTSLSTDEQSSYSSLPERPAGVGSSDPESTSSSQMEIPCSLQEVTSAVEGGMTKRTSGAATDPRLQSLASVASAAALRGRMTWAHTQDGEDSDVTTVHEEINVSTAHGGANSFRAAEQSSNSAFGGRKQQAPPPPPRGQSRLSRPGASAGTGSAAASQPAARAAAQPPSPQLLGKSPGPALRANRPRGGGLPTLLALPRRGLQPLVGLATGLPRCL